MSWKSIERYPEPWQYQLRDTSSPNGSIRYPVEFAKIISTTSTHDIWVGAVSVNPGKIVQIRLFSKTNKMYVGEVISSIAGPCNCTEIIYDECLECPSCERSCPADLNGDGMVGGPDFSAFTSALGPCP